MAKCMICGKVKPVMPCICGDCLPAQKKRGQLPKAELDMMIEAERAYWADVLSQTEDDQRELLDAMSAARRTVEEKLGNRGYALANIISGILGYNGLAKDATNQEIYTILGLLGWKVVEEVQPDGSAL